MNFDEVPRIDPFPEKGILQFYIADDDKYLYGMDHEDMTGQKNFRILYFPDVTGDENNLIAYFDFLPQFEPMPVSDPCALTFEKQYAPISMDDYQFDETIFGESNPSSEEKRCEISNAYLEMFRANGHKIGGYP
ncbi:MAG: DUF1963 domain-containing protein, partial [Anaerolineales bacterium]|nr:DUF1963 domain-containing protein [Anaerolineales bacterium]